MNVKKGIASSVELLMIPSTRSGSACSSAGSMLPWAMPIRPKRRPLAASENATG